MLKESSPEAGQSPNIESKALPEVPPKEQNREEINKSPLYTLNSPLNSILIYRQVEQNVPPMISSAAEVFMSEKVDFEELLSKSGVEDEFWTKLIKKYDVSFVTEQKPPKIEDRLLQGIPENLRRAAYLHILKTRAIIESQTYDNLLKKAKLASFESKTLSSESVLADQCDVLQVYNYCLKGTAHEKSQTNGALSPVLLENLAKILQKINGMSTAEATTLLFKLSDRFANVSAGEFTYKGSRSLEDLAPGIFVHITKQGIDLAGVFETAFERVFDSSLGKDVSLKILDFVLLEGADFLLRLMYAVFIEQQKRILGLVGEELNEFVYSIELFSNVTEKALQKSVDVELPIIAYENEYSITTANAVSGNDNEVANLLETKEELTLKLAGLKEKFAQLQKTHGEIFNQNSEYADRLVKAQEERTTLIERKKALQQKYNQLTMQENLDNTIKANADISRENQDLEAQIEETQKNVDAKMKMIK